MGLILTAEGVSAGQSFPFHLFRRDDAAFIPYGYIFRLGIDWTRTRYLRADVEVAVCKSRGQGDYRLDRLDRANRLSLSKMHCSSPADVGAGDKRLDLYYKLDIVYCLGNQFVYFDRIISFEVLRNVAIPHINIDTF